MAKKLAVSTDRRRSTPKNAERWVGNTGLKRLTIDVEPALHTKLKRTAALQGITMKDALVDLIKDYVAKEK